jgi:hypothetical protein
MFHRGKRKMDKEAKARIKINKLLEEAGWRLLDNEHGKANVLLENHVNLTSTSTSLTVPVWSWRIGH